MDSERVRRLLGSELAQDDPNFLKYAVAHEDLLKRLRNPDNNLIIINAARGSGKSGVILSHEDDIRTTYGPSHIIIKKFHSDAPLPSTFEDYHTALNFWKNSLLGWILSEIGSHLPTPQTADEVIAAGYAEQTGRRRIDIHTSPLRELAPPSGKDRLDPNLSDSFFGRLIEESKTGIWILLDEMDDNYENSPKANVRLNGLLKAAKAVCGIHKNIRIRITIRPHVLSTLERNTDITQTFRQNVVKISWNEEKLLEVLARRIELHDGKDNRQLDLFSERSREETYTEALNRIVGRYFDPFDASFKEKEDVGYRALHTFSLGRPRWMLEFCALALEVADGDRATVRDFKRAMVDYGTNRVSFLAGEHKYQFRDLQAVVNQFASARTVKIGTSDDLRKLIVENILRKGIRSVRRDVTDIDDIKRLEDVAALQIANELFMVELIRARESLGGGREDHRFYTFIDRDSLLSSWVNHDRITWEMHPTFARAFNIIDSQAYKVGAETRLLGERKKDRKRNTNNRPSKLVESEVNKIDD